MLIQGTNNNGKKLIELCRNVDVKIVNGRFGNDYENGNFTCYKPNGKSTVDYAIASPCLFPKIIDFTVDMFDPCLSDVHCPICLALNFDIGTFK